jgi:hypothetical protein
MVEGPGVQPIRVCLDRNAQCFKGSVQLAERKKPLRHLIALSEEFASSNVSAGSGRTLLASSENRFIWASLAHIHGIPGMPEWADWFAGELDTHKAIIRALGIGCAPVLVKGEKEQFLDWLSWGVESGAVSLPAETGSIRWPGFSLEDLFLPPTNLPHRPSFPSFPLFSCSLPRIAARTRVLPPQNRPQSTTT